MKRKVNTELKDPCALHPFLFSTYPALSLFSTNINELHLRVIFLPILLSIFAAFIFWFITWILIKDKNRAALITTVFSISFFSFGHLHDTIWYSFEELPKIFYPQYFLIPYLLITIVIAMLTLKIMDIKNVTRIFNGLTSFLVIVSLVQITVYKLKERPVPKNFRQNIPAVSLNTKTVKDFPDIYYIIPDGYAGQPALKIFYDFNNSSFIDSLRKTGFFVAEKGKANYLTTRLSLASSMNLTYINYLTKKMGAGSDNLSVLDKMIGESLAIDFLHSRGYRIINYNSGQRPTISLSYADKNVFTDKRMNRLLELLLRTSMIKTLIHRVPHSKSKSEILPATFIEITKNIKKESPKFIIAHIMSPHPPFLFTRDGGKAPNLDLSYTKWNSDKKYLDEIIFINDKIKKLVDSILSQSKIPPVIIIQADHGPIRQADHGSISDKIVHEEGRFIRANILNAYLLPEKCRTILYNSITPVNTFRVVFNCLFGTDYKLLEDEVFFSWYDRPFDFKNITREFLE